MQLLLLPGVTVFDDDHQKTSTPQKDKKSNYGIFALCDSTQGNFDDAVGHYTTALEAGSQVLSGAKLGVLYSNR